MIKEITVTSYPHLCLKSPKRRLILNIVLKINAFSFLSDIPPRCFIVAYAYFTGLSCSQVHGTACLKIIKRTGAIISILY